jgi:hypothetical protein
LLAGYDKVVSLRFNLVLEVVGEDETIDTGWSSKEDRKDEGSEGL